MKLHSSLTWNQSLYIIISLEKIKKLTFFFTFRTLHQKNAGLYKCVVNNKYGEINVNLSLIIEVAPVIRDRPIVKKVEKKKSAVLQCAVQGTQNIDVQWFKEGQGISATKGARFSVEKKKSDVREGETSKA